MSNDNSMRIYSGLAGFTAYSCLSSLAYASESAVNAAAKGAITGLALAIIGGLIALIVWIFKKILSTARNAAPVAKEFAKNSAITIAQSVEDIAHSNHKKCPYCAEFIKQEARVCRYCQRDLPNE